MGLNNTNLNLNKSSVDLKTSKLELDKLNNKNTNKMDLVDKKINSDPLNNIKDNKMDLVYKKFNSDPLNNIKDNTKDYLDNDKLLQDTYWLRSVEGINKSVREETSTEDSGYTEEVYYENTSFESEAKNLLVKNEKIIINNNLNTDDSINNHITFENSIDNLEGLNVAQVYSNRISQIIESLLNGTSNINISELMFELSLLDFFLLIIFMLISGILGIIIYLLYKNMLIFLSKANNTILYLKLNKLLANYTKPDWNNVRKKTYINFNFDYIIIKFKFLNIIKNISNIFEGLSKKTTTLKENYYTNNSKFFISNLNIINYNKNLKVNMFRLPAETDQSNSSDQNDIIMYEDENTAGYYLDLLDNQSDGVIEELVVEENDSTATDLPQVQVNDSTDTGLPQVQDYLDLIISNKFRDEANVKLKAFFKENARIILDINNLIKGFYIKETERLMFLTKMALLPNRFIYLNYLKENLKSSVLCKEGVKPYIFYKSELKQRYKWYKAEISKCNIEEYQIKCNENLDKFFQESMDYIEIHKKNFPDENLEKDIPQFNSVKVLGYHFKADDNYFWDKDEQFKTLFKLINVIRNRAWLAIQNMDGYKNLNLKDQGIMRLNFFTDYEELYYILHTGDINKMNPGGEIEQKLEYISNELNLKYLPEHYFDHVLNKNGNVGSEARPTFISQLEYSDSEFMKSFCLNFHEAMQDLTKKDFNFNKILKVKSPNKANLDLDLIKLKEIRLENKLDLYLTLKLTFKHLLSLRENYIGERPTVYNDCLQYLDKICKVLTEFLKKSSPK